MTFPRTVLTFEMSKESRCVHQCTESRSTFHMCETERMQDKVQQRIDKMRNIQSSLTAADLARREKELARQIAALEAKRELSEIWMHVRTSGQSTTFLVRTCGCILHIQQLCLQVDMDAFYASCEERDNPELASIPVASTSPTFSHASSIVTIE